MEEEKYSLKNLTKEELKIFVGMTAPAREDIAIHHSYFMQCFFPLRRVDPSKEYYETVNGKVSVAVERGSLYMPGPNGERILTKQEIPSGTKARLVLNYINNQAYLHKTNVIDMGNSLRKFMERNHVPIGGANYKELLQQSLNISAAKIYLGITNPDKSVSTKKTNITMIHTVPAKEQVMTLWKNELHLSDEYYNSLKENKIPIDFRIMVLLQNNARAMDLYCWLTYRAPGVKYPLKMPYTELHAMFGQGVKELLDFKKLFKKSLNEVLKVYPSAAVDTSHKDYIIIYRSEPSVPKETYKNLPLFERRINFKPQT